MAKNQGGEAFPCFVWVEKQPYGGSAYQERQDRPGMTLRQYYKAAALGVILTVPQNRESNPRDMASIAGRIADAMIKEDEDAAKA